MTLISGVLKGPYGDPRSGVTITMRAVKTSSAVLSLAKSQSVTDDGGKYALAVEPGAYEVIISVYGAQPERVGAIEVYNDSLPGTLNDFLRRPGKAISRRRLCKLSIVCVPKRQRPPARLLPLLLRQKLASRMRQRAPLRW